MSETKALREVLEIMRKYAGLSCRFFPGWVNEASAELDALLAENAKLRDTLLIDETGRPRHLWQVLDDLEQWKKTALTYEKGFSEARIEVLDLNTANALLRKQLDEAIRVIKAFSDHDDYIGRKTVKQVADELLERIKK